MKLLAISCLFIGSIAAAADEARVDQTLGAKEMLTHYPGQCYYDADPQSKVFAKVKSSELGACVKLDNADHRLLRVIPDDKPHMFGSMCTVTISVLSGTVDKCGSVPNLLGDGDEMTITPRGKDELRLAYDFIDPRYPTLNADLTPVTVVLNGKRSIVAYKTSLAVEGRAYEMYVYLRHGSIDAATGAIDKFYSVELFGYDEKSDCRNERPGVSEFDEVNPCPPQVPVMPKNPAFRQTGSGTGGDPPRTP